jgi:hypothetical protein
VGPSLTSRSFEINHQQSHTAKVQIQDRHFERFSIVTQLSEVTVYAPINYLLYAGSGT